MLSFAAVGVLGFFSFDLGQYRGRWQVRAKTDSSRGVLFDPLNAELDPRSKGGVPARAMRYVELDAASSQQLNTPET